MTCDVDQPTKEYIVEVAISIATSLSSNYVVCCLPLAKKRSSLRIAIALTKSKMTYNKVPSVILLESPLLPGLSRALPETPQRGKGDA